MDGLIEGSTVPTRYSLRCQGAETGCRSGWWRRPAGRWAGHGLAMEPAGTSPKLPVGTVKSILAPGALRLAAAVK